jgi:hypothetical protein
MKKVIISIHGFNSGPGKKAEELQNQFPDYVVEAPQLPYDPNQAIEVLTSLVDKYSDTEIHIVGTSLGGFYTMYLSVLYKERDNILYYVINPSFEPQVTLQRYGIVQNFKTGEYFATTLELFKSFAVMYEHVIENYDTRCIHSSNYFIGTFDEVLDFSNFKSFIYSMKVPVRMYYSEQDHRYSDISTVVDKLKENMFL